MKRLFKSSDRRAYPSVQEIRLAGQQLLSPPVRRRIVQSKSSFKFPRLTQLKTPQLLVMVDTSKSKTSQPVYFERQLKQRPQPKPRAKPLPLLSETRSQPLEIKPEVQDFLKTDLSGDFEPYLAFVKSKHRD